jgi:hypothetical protein
MQKEKPKEFLPMQGMESCTAVIPIRRRLRQEDHKFKASLGYIVSSCSKKKKKLID